MNILLAFYIMIPAYLANMAPPFAKWIPFNAPMDFGLSIGGKRIFGSHKTWTGFALGLIVAVIAGYFMSFYWPFEFSAVYWAFLLGFGALVGDVAKSFFKRRVGVKPGKPWIPFDQIDYTVGALIFGSSIFFPGWLYAVLIVVISAVGHIIVNHIGYFLGVRDVKW